MTAVQARVHFALKQEFKLLKNIIRDYTDPDYTYTPEYGTRKAKKADYDLVDIIPVSDPNAATMSQRVIQYQAVIQMAQMAPDIYNLPELHRGMLNVLGIKNAEKLVPIEDDQKPIDPVQENQNALKGNRLKRSCIKITPRTSGAHDADARPDDAAVHWPEPTGSQDHGCDHGTHCRARWLQNAPAD
jgi:hypothetical protein